MNNQSLIWRNTKRDETATPDIFKIKNESTKDRYERVKNQYSSGIDTSELIKNRDLPLFQEGLN